jgi:predicted dehydrogenase
MGQRHLQIARDLGIEVVGICDQNAAILASVGSKLDIPEGVLYQDAGAMLKGTHPECVIVATTAPSHCELTCFAAQNGANYILCEKPMAVSLNQCDEILKACRGMGARLAINHQMRFMEQYREPKRIVHSEEFGGLCSVTVVAGNFGMAMNGTHYFEMFRYLTGEDPVEAQAWFSPGKVPNPRGPQFEDRAGSVRLTTRSGKRFYMEIGADQGHGMQVVYAGPHGRLTVDELAGRMHLAVRKREHRSLPTTRYGMPWTETATGIQPADAVAPSRQVLKSLLKDNNYPTGEHGRLAVAALAAAYVSDENGHVPVKIDNGLPLDRIFPWA